MSEIEKSVTEQNKENYMKLNLIAAGLMLASSAALACPDLSGSYTCTEEGAKPMTDHLVITQSSSAISWTDGQEAQGQFKLEGPTKTHVMGVPVSYTVTCSGSEMTLIGTTKLPFVGEKAVITTVMTQTREGLKAVTASQTGVQNAVCVRK